MNNPEEGKDTPAMGEAPEVKAEAATETPAGLKLIIEMGKDGKIAVTGPLDNQLICMGMIEMGKEAIINFHRERAMRQMSAMKAPNGIIPGLPPLVVQ